MSTEFSATLPELDDTTELYDSILNEEFLEDARATVVSLTRGVLVDWQPRFLEIVEKISLPRPQEFAIAPPVNQTSACS